MAVSELGSVDELASWEQPVPKPLLQRMVQGTARFARRKPLGFLSAMMILTFMFFGDLVPETINKISQATGIADTPVPYVADLLADNTSFIYSFDKQDLRARLEGPSSRHLLGTDDIGRDILSRLLYGARTAVLVSFGAVFISEIIAITVGISAAYYAGWFDKIAYRFVDIFDALPGLIVLITILGIFGSGLWPLIVVIGILGGPSGSRLIRGQAISVMASPYVESARVVGARDTRIMATYVLPNVFPLVILGSTLRLGRVVLIEASLSFLGFGLPPPFPSWGQMLSLEGREFMRTQPGLAIYPGLLIGILVFSYNLFGDAIRDTLDPRLRGSR